MEVLENTLNAKLRDADPATRVKAIAGLNTDDVDAELLPEIAIGDAVQEVRIAAIQRIASITTLSDIIGSVPGDAERLSIMNRFEGIANDQGNDASVITSWNTLLKAVPDKKLILKFALKSHSILLGLECLEHLHSDEDFLCIAKEAGLRDIQLSAVDRICQIDVLKALQKKTNDKKFQQHIRKRIKEHKDHEKEIRLQHARAEECCSHLQSLAKSVNEVHYAERLQSLMQTWSEIPDEIKCDYQEEVDSARKRCEEKLATYRQYEREQESKLEANQHIEQVFASVDEFLQNLAITPLENVEDLYDLRNNLDQYWKEYMDNSGKNSRVEKDYNAARESLSAYAIAWERLSEVDLSNLVSHAGERSESLSELRNKLKKLEGELASVNWQEAYAKPEDLSSLEELQKDARSQVKQAETEAKKKAARIDKKVGLLGKHIRDKNLIAANRLANYIQVTSEKLESEYRRSIKKHMARLNKELDELREWQRFVTEPKKIALCDEMEALSNKNLKPLKLAEEIRSLQSQWRQLCCSDPSLDDALWDRFKTAADKAYEPCQAYYHARDQQRAGNLKSIIALCEELEDYVKETNWDEVDWKEVTAKEKQARDKWKRTRPLPKDAEKEMQKRFDEAISAIRTHLDEERENNIESRKDLVARAQKLVELKDLKLAIERLDWLHQKWKKQGPTFQKVDREQWALFKAASDVIYDKHHGAIREEKGALSANARQLEDLIKQIKDLTALEDDALERSYSEYENIRSSYNKELKLPEKIAKKLEKRFIKQCEAYEDRYRGLDARKTDKQRLGILEFSDLCSDAENAVIADRKDELGPIIEKIRAFDGLTPEQQAEFKDRVAMIYAAQQEDSKEAFVSKLDENCSRLQQLTLELEIISDVETPAEFRSQRMQFQLQQLQENRIGKLSPEQKKEKYMSLEHEWCIVGPLEPEIRKALQSRLDMCRKALGIKT